MRYDKETETFTIISPEEDYLIPGLGKAFEKGTSVTPTKVDFPSGTKTVNTAINDPGDVNAVGPHDSYVDTGVGTLLNETFRYFGGFDTVNPPPSGCFAGIHSAMEPASRWQPEKITLPEFQ